MQNKRPLVVLSHDTSLEVIAAMKATGHLQVVVELSPVKKSEFWDRVIGLNNKFSIIKEQELINGVVEANKLGLFKSNLKIV